MRLMGAVWSILIIAQAAFIGSASADDSPFPDPAEHSAFQRQELQRLQGWRRFAEQPATKRSRLQDRYDVTYYRLAIDLRNVPGERIRGDVTTVLHATAGPLDTLLFDLSATMDVDSVVMRGDRTPFFRSGDAVFVRPRGGPVTDQYEQVRIYYQGHPTEAGFGAFTWSEHAGTPLIWSLSEPEGARQWWPCKDRPDDKADSLDVLVRAPAGLIATSNGLLTETTNNPDGSHTFHWKHRYPITTYLVCVTASDYERIEDRYVAAPGDTMLIEHFVYPDVRRLAEIDFSITAEAIGAFAERYGPYPFLREKYGHTLFPWSGGMEHQTNTSYGGNLITGLHRLDAITVHELSHQWWGDMTTCADWRDVWLNEGFATYSEAIWYEHRSGPEGYREFMTRFCRVTDPSGPIYDPTVDLFDSNTIYNKGAWVVHMLRGALGDSLFFASLAEYRERTAYRSTTTAEFQAIVEEVAGRPMDWFFQPWVYGTDRPHYEVSFLPFGEPGLPSVAIHLDQTQVEPAFFEMPVEFQVELEGGGSVRTRIWNDPDHGDLELDLPAGATGVTVDPDNWILDATVAAPYTMHITTAKLPEGHAGGAYDAVVHARGGTPPYEWTAYEPLPPGIALDGETGRLTGTAPDSGSYSLSLRVIDKSDLSDIQNYLLIVAAPPEAGGACCAPEGACTIAEQSVQCQSSSEWHPEWTSCEPNPCPQPDHAVDLKIGPMPAKAWAGFTMDGPQDGWFNLKVYDLLGREVRTIWDGRLPPRAISWNGRDNSDRGVPSGVYIARLKCGASEIKRRVVWVR